MAERLVSMGIRLGDTVQVVQNQGGGALTGGVLTLRIAGTRVQGQEELVKSFPGIS